MAGWLNFSKLFWTCAADRQSVQTSLPRSQILATAIAGDNDSCFGINHQRTAISMSKQQNHQLPHGTAMPGVSSGFFASHHGPNDT